MDLKTTPMDKNMTPMDKNMIATQEQKHNAMDENHAYGRQSISRPMRIVAPIPSVGWTKNTQKPEFFEKRKKIIQNAKTQKRLEIWQN